MAEDWVDYEKQIHKQLCEEFADARVIRNQRILGKESKIKRQIDVLISGSFKRKKYTGIAECKYLNKKVDIGKIDAFIGKMTDVQADFGIILSGLGFTRGAISYAKKANIDCRKVSFEFLKDFDFTTSNELDSDLFIQETEYTSSYCEKCKVTNLYEIKIVRGFGDDDEPVICPECKTPHIHTRTDGGYRVIKRFNTKEVTANEEEEFIVKHLLDTRNSWDKRHSIEWEFTKHKDPNELCFICFKEMTDRFPGSFKVAYASKTICNECFMSKRTLLIDYDKL